MAEIKHNVLELMTKRIQFRIIDYSQSKALAMADSELARRYSHAVSLIKRHILNRYSAAGVNEAVASSMIDVDNGEFILNNRYFYVSPKTDPELDRLFKELKKINSASKEVHHDSMQRDCDVMDGLIRAYEVFSNKNPNAREVLQTKEGVKKIKEYREKFYRITQVERDEIGRNLRSYLLSEIKRIVINFYDDCVKYDTVPLCYKAFNDAVKAEGRNPFEMAESAKLSKPYINTNADYSEAYINSLIEKYHIAAFGENLSLKKQVKPTAKKSSSAPVSTKNAESKSTAPSSKATKNETKEATKKQESGARKSETKRADASLASQSSPQPENEKKPITTDESQFKIENKICKKYLGEDESLVIPCGIKKIGSSAFSKNKHIKNVVIPEGVSEIASLAFYKCQNLESVTLPSTLKIIKNNVFESCVKLRDIKLPDGLTKLEGKAFLRCESLREISIPRGLETIEINSFSDCKSLENVIFPDNLKKVGMMAFGGCVKLKSVTLPKGCKHSDFLPSFPEDCKVKFK